MTLTSCELREKDVINVCDGKKLGYICDMDIDTDCGYDKMHRRGHNSRRRRKNMPLRRKVQGRAEKKRLALRFVNKMLKCKNAL